MLFRQFIHEDLGCASYLVGDVGDGSAAVVDPQWRIEPYLELAREHGVAIRHVLETHTHADHVSGHGRLVAVTGATIHIHELAEAEYPREPFSDGWRLTLGELEIEALHTPGHRPEHTSFLLRDRSRGQEPWALLSGDFAFVGDVARPDLAVEPAAGARELFHSLRERLLTLPAEVELWPGHLGGSLCASSGIDHKSSSTVGFERRHNRAMKFEGVEEFVADALASLGERPPNVERIVALNRGRLLDNLGTPEPMAPGALAAAIGAGATVVDARTNDEFDAAHIQGALSASALVTGFATKIARVVDPDGDLMLVGASDDRALAAAELLASVGLATNGYLAGGLTAWSADDRPLQTLEAIDPGELRERLDAGDKLTVLDVRDAGEYAEGHIPGSLLIPFAELPERMDELPREGVIATICGGGKRSGLAASILQAGGLGSVIRVGHGGVGSWHRGGGEIEVGEAQL